MAAVEAMMTTTITDAAVEEDRVRGQDPVAVAAIAVVQRIAAADPARGHQNDITAMPRRLAANESALDLDQDHATADVIRTVRVLMTVTDPDPDHARAGGATDRALDRPAAAPFRQKQWLLRRRLSSYQMALRKPRS